MNPHLELIAARMHAVLKPVGFKKEKLVWRHALPEMIQIIGLDKSTYSNAYQLIYGLSLLKYGLNPRPGLNYTHVGWSTSNQFPVEDRMHLHHALDLEGSMPDAERLETVEVSLRRYVLPTFDATNTVEKLQGVLTAGKKSPYSMAMLWKIERDNI